MKYSASQKLLIETREVALYLCGITRESSFYKHCVHTYHALGTPLQRAHCLRSLTCTRALGREIMSMHNVYTLARVFVSLLCVLCTVLATRASDALVST